MVKGRRTRWDKLLESASPDCGDECPRLTTIIPTYNSSHTVSITLRSLAQQNYPHHELIVLDAGSTDRTLDIVKGYKGKNLKIYSVTEYNVYEMFNRGASFATGSYLNFLFPGDFYISQDSLGEVGNLVTHEKNPDMIYGGSLLRDAYADPRVLYRPFNLKLLKRGKQPTSLQSCWWKSSTFSLLGKFKTSLKLRGGFDLMCRFMLTGGLRVATTTRVLTDYDRRNLTHKMILLHFWETLPILIRTFGLRVATLWWMTQKDLVRSLRLWIRGVRVAFFGR